MSTAADVIGGTATWSVELADCLDWLRGLPESSVDLVFGSPPYEQARSYLENGQDLCIARKTDDWVAWMLEVFQAGLRACRGLVAFVVEGQTEDYRWSAGPVLLMADLARAGVCLRKPWAFHRVGIPGSGGPDWFRNDFEFVVCATARRGRLPWSDPKACGHPPKWAPGGAMSHRVTDGSRVNQRGGNGGGAATGRPGRYHATAGAKDGDTVNGRGYRPPDVANPGNVISCKVGGGNIGSPMAHENEAPFPEALAERAVRSFCPVDGIVADPFCGGGTTLAVARRWNRRAAGCDNRQSQVDLTTRRVEVETPVMREMAE
jgi:hypothetical protein